MISRAMLHVVTMLLIVTVNFALPRLMPGDPVRLLLGADVDSIPPELAARTRERLGLDRPLPVQFALYLRGLAGGDLGHSFSQRQAVATVIGRRLPWTLLLSGTSLFVAIVVGVALGAIGAWRGSNHDTAVLGTAIALNSLPSFWLAMMLLVLFAGRLRWLPAFGARTPGLGFSVGDTVSHLVLPAATLALAQVGEIALLARAAVRDVRREPFLLAAAGKGLSDMVVLFRHAVVAACLPLVARLGLLAGFALGGSALVETVFSYPGLGRMLYEAVLARDYPLVQGGFLVVCSAVVACNLLADLAYGILDPRVRSRP